MAQHHQYADSLISQILIDWTPHDAKHWSHFGQSHAIRGTMMLRTEIHSNELPLTRRPGPKRVCFLKKLDIQTTHLSLGLVAANLPLPNPH